MREIQPGNKESFGRRRGTGGFSLIELMVTIAIVGVLAAVAVPLYRSYIARAVMSETLTKMDQFTTEAALYYQSEGELPMYSDVDLPAMFATHTSIYGEDDDVWNLILYYTTWNRQRTVVLFYSKNPHRFGNEFWQVAMLFRTDNGFFESNCTSNDAVREALPQTCHNSLLNWSW